MKEQQAAADANQGKKEGAPDRILGPIDKLHLSEREHQRVDDVYDLWTAAGDGLTRAALIAGKWG